MKSVRDDVLSVYHAALSAVEGRRCVRDRLLQDVDHDASSLHRSFPGQPFPNQGLWLIALGKAAVSMAQGAFDAFGKRIQDALIITRHGYGKDLTPWPVTLIESGHPLPDRASLDAGKALLDFIRALPERAPCLVLISGGASSLAEVLPKGMTLKDLASVNDWLLGAGQGIRDMNRVRKALSCIKGGRLARYFKGHPLRVLLLSDVPGDDPSVIGSGLLAPDIPAPLPPSLPDWIRRLMTDNAPPSPEASCFATIQTDIVAGSRMARDAAARQAQQLGYRVERHERILLDDVAAVARQIYTALQARPDRLHIWSAEPSVVLPESPGRGGRCQALALSVAQLDDGWEKGVHTLTLLAAGTDGSDGPGEVAGALIDEKTVSRGRQAGRSLEQDLDTADSGRFLEASGDVLVTGPTGSNVMDLVIAFLQPGQG